MLKQICGSGLYKDVEDVLSQNLFSDSDIFSGALDACPESSAEAV